MVVLSLAPRIKWSKSLATVPLCAARWSDSWMSGTKQRHVRCAVPGCMEKQRSLYNLPKDQSTRRNWLEFIFNYNVPETFSPYMLVCCQHFESSCFANQAQYNAGFASKLLLLPGAIPTVDLRCPPEHKLSVSRSTIMEGNIVHGPFYS